MDARGLDNRDAAISCFLKREATIKRVDPRNISPRNPEFLAVLGPYIAAMEAKACRSPFMVKGLNIKSVQRKLAWLTGYSHYLEIDYSRFDMTLNRVVLETLEHAMLTKCFPRGLHHELHLALELARSPKGRYRCGVSYNADGTRCSGDAHTSFGNTLLNRFFTWVCLRKLPKSAWRSVHEGDDGIIALRERYVNQAVYNLGFLGCMGLEPKIKVSANLHDVVFCGRVLHETAGGLISTCDVPRALHKFHTSVSDGDPMLLLLCKAVSYLYTDGETPVLGSLASVLIMLLVPKIRSIRRFNRTMGRVLKERYMADVLIGGKKLFMEGVLQDAREWVKSEYHAVLEANLLHTYQIPPHLFDRFVNQFEAWLKVGYIPNEVEALTGYYAVDHNNTVVYPAK